VRVFPSPDDNAACSTRRALRDRRAAGAAGRDSRTAPKSRGVLSRYEGVILWSARWRSNDFPPGQAARRAGKFCRGPRSFFGNPPEGEKTGLPTPYKRRPDRYRGLGAAVDGCYPSHTPLPASNLPPPLILAYYYISFRFFPRARLLRHRPPTGHTGSATPHAIGQPRVAPFGRVPLPPPPHRAPLHRNPGARGFGPGG